MDVVTRGNRRC